MSSAGSGPGWLVLLGVAKGDADEDAHRLAEKVVGLRAFEDAAGKMNLGGARGRRLGAGRQPVHLAGRLPGPGRRPSFIGRRRARRGRTPLSAVRGEN